MDRQFKLQGMPLTEDEQLLLKRLGSWCQSGIGGMRSDTISHQLGWPERKAHQVIESLVERGLIWRCSWIGEYFIEKYFPKKEHGQRSEQLSALLAQDYELAEESTEAVPK